jgi:hypothetical protein
MIKRTLSAVAAAAVFTFTLLTGPSFNFSQTARAEAIVILCSDGSEPHCMPIVVNGKAGVFCSC